MGKNKIELEALLSRYKPFDQDDKDSLSMTLTFLKENDNVFGNSNLKGHITASVWLLDYMGENVLLTHHKKLNRWLQLGGHTEVGETIHESALREAVEESGLHDLAFLNHQIYDVDVHEIPARNDLPAHLHYDIRFIIQQKSPEAIMISDESNDLKWIKIDQVSEFSTSPSILRLVEKMREVDFRR